MSKLLLINPANHLFGKKFNLCADVRADTHIRASISTHVPWNVIDNNITHKKMSEMTGNMIMKLLTKRKIDKCWKFLNFATDKW